MACEEELLKKEWTTPELVILDVISETENGIFSGIDGSGLNDLHS